MANGLYTSSNADSYKDHDTIMQEAYLAQETPVPQFVNYQSPERDFFYWITRLEERAKQYQETEETRQDAVEVNLPAVNTLVYISTDHHMGSPHTMYDRIRRELGLVYHTPNAYLMLGGDSIDNFFWNQTTINDTAEQIPEQVNAFREMVRYLEARKKILGMWHGNHDDWSKKMGMSVNDRMFEICSAPVFWGVGKMILNIGDVQYRIAGSHQLKGFSMYNENHPQERYLRFDGGRGADIIWSGHTHKKAFKTSTYKDFDGAHRVTMINTGAYKRYDSYGSTLGMDRLDPKQMFGVPVILRADRKEVMPMYDLFEAHETLLKLSA